VSYPFLAVCLWLLAWLFVSVMTAAAWAVLRGHDAALAVLLAAAFAAVVLAWSGAVLW
jgi:hypothetical protein